MVHDHSSQAIVRSTTSAAAASAAVTRAAATIPCGRPLIFGHLDKLPPAPLTVAAATVSVVPSGGGLAVAIII
jgi:hypothetical protein